MCSTIGVSVLSNNATNAAYSGMFREALQHFGDRLGSIVEEVRLLDQRVTELGSQVAEILEGNRSIVKESLNKGSPSKESSGKVPGSSRTAALTKRVALLEAGQQTVASGARRALNKAMAVHRLLDGDRSRVDRLDEQIAKLMTQAPAFLSLPGPPNGALAAWKPCQSLVQLMEEAVAEAEQEESRSECRSGSTASLGFGRNAVGGQSLHDGHSTTDQLLGAARAETERLRADLKRASESQVTQRQPQPRGQLAAQACENAAHVSAITSISRASSTKALEPWYGATNGAAPQQVIDPEPVFARWDGGVLGTSEK